MRLVLSDSDIRALAEQFPDGVYTNVNLAAYSRWKIGGIAKCMITPSSVVDLQACLIFCKQRNLKFVILGATSNLLFSDEGLNVLAISLVKLKSFSIAATHIKVGAGIWVPNLARNLANLGLSGVEHIVGIPGSLGGLVYMNGGSQRKGISEHIHRVITLTYDGELRTYLKDECEFSYRHSSFQYADEIIIDVELTLFYAPQKTIRNEMLSILRSRRQKFPLVLPNCGSVFVSNPAMYEEYGPPGAVIEQCGLKGKQIGMAQVSPMHANFIVNKGGAKACDVLQLIKKMQDSVCSKTGYKMVSEVRYMSKNGDVLPAADVPVL